MITTLIVEDNIEQLHALENVISSSFRSMRILSSTNYEAAKKIVDTESIHFFLLDIELSPLKEAPSGITLGNYIRSLPAHKHTPILFLTARMDQMEAALNQTHCYSYLIKPYQYEALIHSMEELLHSPLLPKKSVLQLKDINGIFFRLEPEEIQYVQCISKTLHLYTSSGLLKTRQLSISQLIEQLPSDFCQCHKSYLVNCNYIKNYDKALKLVYMNDSQSLPVGRKYKDTLERILSYENNRH